MPLPKPPLQLLHHVFILLLTARILIMHEQATQLGELRITRRTLERTPSFLLNVYMVSQVIPKFVQNPGPPLVAHSGRLVEIEDVDFGFAGSGF